MSQVAIAYIPVLHKGYLNFLDEVAKRNIQKLFLIGDEVLRDVPEFDYLNRKDRIRAIPTETIMQFVKTYCAVDVTELTYEALASLVQENVSVFTPYEDVATVFLSQHVPAANMEYARIFLRWDKERVTEDKEPEGEEISANEFQQTLLAALASEAAKSSDWWRQVSAALIKNGNVIALAHNQHMPDEQLPNVFGDTRALFKKGDHIEYVTTAHAEVGVIGEAAQKGISTEGAELYVTDFPCPYCARLIAKSGIKKLYFQKGYAVLAGDTFLRDAGVAVVKIKK